MGITNMLAYATMLTYLHVSLDVIADNDIIIDLFVMSTSSVIEKFPTMTHHQKMSYFVSCCAGGSNVTLTHV